MEDKYTGTELIGILQYAVPEYYRTAFNLKDYIPMEESKHKFIAKCERVERNKPPKSHERDEDEDDCKSSKKVKFANSANSIKKSGSRASTGDSSMFCTRNTVSS
jgi:hypothetical protein